MMKFYLIYVEGNDRGAFTVKEGPFNTKREVELAAKVLLADAEAWGDAKYFIISSPEEVKIEEVER